MTLTKAMTILETLLNQQMSDEAEEAIRTVLDELKTRNKTVAKHSMESLQNTQQQERKHNA